MQSYYTTLETKLASTVQELTHLQGEYESHKARLVRAEVTIINQEQTKTLNEPNNTQLTNIQESYNRSQEEKEQLEKERVAIAIKHDKERKKWNAMYESVLTKL